MVGVSKALAQGVWVHGALFPQHLTPHTALHVLWEGVFSSCQILGQSHEAGSDRTKTYMWSNLKLVPPCWMDQGVERVYVVPDPLRD